MRNFILILWVLIVGYSCENLKRTSLAEGTWRAELTVQDNEILPFSFDLKQLDGHPVIDIHNAEEIIHVDEIEILKDSLIIRMPVFEGYIAGKFTDTTITGEFINESLNRVVPFSATQGELTRFNAKQGASMNVSGIWETEFSPDTIGSYLGKGIFTQEGNKVKGTFRTTTGDYRYLEGIMDGDLMKLSAFDGAHAFLFVAKVTDSTINGTFYSGNHFQEPFEGRRNVNFELPDADSLTFLKPGHGKFNFSFPNTEREQVSLEDAEFKNKPIIVQIMGTWCPNCLDESKFLVNYLEENPQLNVAVVGLAFEYAKTEEEAFGRINRLKNAIGIEYPVLLAQYGSSSKIRAQEKLPMLNHVLSYPTTIFIDKNGAVKKIHTGFNGPATGDKYDSFKKEFDAFVKQLASE